LLDLPIAYLIIAPAMASFDVSLEESSRVCSAGPMRTLFRITLPVLRPAILAAFILCTVRCLASFAVPSVLGMPGRKYVLATYIYRAVSAGLVADYGKAAAIGMSILVTSIVLIYVYRYFTRSSERFVTVSSRGFKPSVVNLKKPSIPCSHHAFPVLHTHCPAGAGAAVHILCSLRDGSRSQGLLHDEPEPLAGGHQGSDLPVVPEEQPVPGYSGSNPWLCLSILVSYVIVKVKTKASGLLESISFLSFSFPGIVIGIGFMWFFVRTPLYATIWALLLGYIATYLPYGIRPLTSALIQIHSHLEESSSVCGAGFFTTLRRVVIPLLVPGIVSAWILMATMFFRELTLSVVLSRPGTEVLAVQILRFSEDGQWGRLSALGIIMIFFSTIMVVGVSMLGNRLRPAEFRQ
jgi:iron(III) transport system permease protein